MLSTQLASRWLKRIGQWLVIVTVSLVCLRLGFWQLSRAEEKQALFDRYELSIKQPPIPVRDIATLQQLRSGSDSIHRIILIGRYDSAHQLLLDNQVHEGWAGLRVWTPLRLSDGVVLVDRGWVPWGRTREQLPAIEVSQEERTVTGILSHFPEAGMRAGQGIEAGDWPRLVNYPRWEELQAATDIQVAPVLLLLDPDVDDGYLRNWRPQVMQPSTHYGYAIQWFSLSVVWLILIGAWYGHRYKGKADAV